MAGVVAGGLFNAIAFAGAGYVFHKLDKNGYEKEMKTRRGDGKTFEGKRKMVRKNREKKKEQDRITTKIK